MFIGIHNLVSFFYLLIDILLLSVAFFMPTARYQHAAVNFEQYIEIYALWIVATLFFCRLHNLYATDRYLSTWRETRRTVRALTYSTLLTAVLIFFFKLTFFSRFVMIANYSLALAFLVSWRLVKRQIVRYMVVKGFNNKNVLVVGAGKSGQQYLARLLENQHLGLRVVGFLDDHLEIGSKVGGKPVLGTFKDYRAVIQRHFVEHMLVASHSPRALISELLEYGRTANVTVQMVPDFFNVAESMVNLRMIGGSPVLEYHTLTPNYGMIIFKRVLDIILSSVALIALSPIFLLIAIAVKLDSRGPVFYSSKRWGLKGRLFNCYKFRSMMDGADTLQSKLRKKNEVDGPVFKMKKDPRLTRVGKFLRRHSIDEFPQIWNVLKGDMSIVGPRPLPEGEQVGNYKLDYLRRLSIKPGLTCLWQVRGRSNVSFMRWMRWDSFYMKHWSPLLDLRIIFWTIPAVIKGRGAY